LGTQVLKHMLVVLVNYTYMYTILVCRLAYPQWRPQTSRELKDCARVVCEERRHPRE
jgi:hypothetical protein